MRRNFHSQFIFHVFHKNTLVVKYERHGSLRKIHNPEGRLSYYSATTQCTGYRVPGIRSHSHEPAAASNLQRRGDVLTRYCLVRFLDAVFASWQRPREAPEPPQ